MAVTVGRSYDANLNYVGTGAGQWTVITPSGTWQNGYGVPGSYPASGTSMLVYVSKEAGASDSNSGSSSSPFSTLAHAYSVLRDGQPDWMLLRKGDTWTDEFIYVANPHGLSNDAPQVITSYSSTGIDATHPRGTATGARPKLTYSFSPADTGKAGIYQTTDAGRNVTLGPLAIIGIEIASNNMGVGGLRFNQRPGTWLLVEDVYVHDVGGTVGLDGIEIVGYNQNTVTTAPFNQTLNTVICRRNIINNNAGGSGFYSAACANFTFEENCIIGTAPGVTTVFSHNFYISGYKPDGLPTSSGPDSCGIPNAGQLDMVQHAGGNININEPISSGSHYRSGGTITDQLSINFRWAFDFSYATKQAIVVNNVGLQGTGASAFQGRFIEPLNNGWTYNGDVYSTSNGCIIYNNIYTDPGSDSIDIGINLSSGWDYIDVQRNVLNGILENPIYNVTGGSNVNIASNNYTKLLSGGWSPSTPPGMLSGGDTRTLASYMVATFGSGALAQFITGCLAQSADNWVYGYTANSVNNYFRAGFNITYYTLGVSVVVAPPTIPGTGTVGTTYPTQTFSASGGTSPYTWSCSPSPPVPGLTFHPATATLDGIPTTAGSFSFTVYANDSSAPSVQGSQPYSVVISPAVVITVSPSTIPKGVVGTLYVTQNFSASGGTAPYTWTHSGTVPPGLNFNDATAQLSGTPTTTTGSPFTFTVTVTDSSASPVSQPNIYTVTIAPPLALSPLSLPPGTVGIGYDQTVTGTGGVPPYTYAVTSGFLPTGLSLNNSTGRINGGAPNTQGPFTFNIHVTDSVSSTPADRSYTVVISPSVTVGVHPMGAICM
jgi:hypothetical protein